MLHFINCPKLYMVEKYDGDFIITTQRFASSASFTWKATNTLQACKSTLTFDLDKHIFKAAIA